MTAVTQINIKHLVNSGNFRLVLYASPFNDPISSFSNVFFCLKRVKTYLVICYLKIKIQA